MWNKNWGDIVVAFAASLLTIPYWPIFTTLCELNSDHCHVCGLNSVHSADDSLVSVNLNLFPGGACSFGVPAIAKSAAWICVWR